MNALDTDFNTDFHEALTMIPSPEKKGKVVDVVEKGYMLREKVLRFAKVVVGN
jgi:molecular chaperone GrpE